MVKETMRYYLQNGSNVYGTALDATKTFDIIDVCKIFREMIKRKIPPLVIRLIMEMYENKVWLYGGTMSIPIRLVYRMEEK